jgi:hypothetical protein
MIIYPPIISKTCKIHIDKRTCPSELTVDTIMCTVGSEVNTAVVVKSSIFWVTAPCRLLRVSQSCEGKYRLHLQGRRISGAGHERESTLLPTKFHAVS